MPAPSTGWPATPACSAPHPSRTCRLGIGEDSATRIALDAVLRRRRASAATTCLVHALRHQRQHLRRRRTLAEKSADLIMGNTPLAAINEPFYRHVRQGNGTAATDGRAAGPASDGEATAVGGDPRGGALPRTCRAFPGLRRSVRRGPVRVRQAWEGVGCGPAGPDSAGSGWPAELHTRRCPGDRACTFRCHVGGGLPAAARSCVRVRFRQWRGFPPSFESPRSGREIEATRHGRPPDQPRGVRFQRSAVSRHASARRAVCGAWFQWPQPGHLDGLRGRMR